MWSQIPCQFLGLPVELRLVIYQHALHDEVDITIGCEQCDAVDPHTSDQPSSSRSTKYRPAIKGGYHAALLSPAANDIASSSIHEASQLASNVNLPTTTHTALLATCRTTRAELRDHFPQPAQRRTNVFIQFPDGLNLLNTAFPRLAHHARSLNITGIYRPEGYYNPDVRAHLPPTDPLATALYTYNSHNALSPAGIMLSSAAAAAEAASPPISPSSPSCALSTLLTTHICPSPTTTTTTSSSSETPEDPHLSLLRLRIFFPGPDGYSTAWSDEASPIAIALRSIPVAEFRLENWHRGGDGSAAEGTGIVLHVRRSEREERTVRAIWRRWVGRGPGRGGGDDDDDDDGGGKEWWREWLVDERWPRSEVEYSLPDD